MVHDNLNLLPLNLIRIQREHMWTFSYFFLEDIGNESLNRSAEMMEIDARLNALQRFMKENMPWCFDRCATVITECGYPFNL